MTIGEICECGLVGGHDSEVHDKRLRYLARVVAESRPMCDEIRVWEAADMMFSDGYPGEFDE